MSRKFVGFVVLACLVLLPVSAMAARPYAGDMGPSITVVGHAELSLKADQAKLYIGVISQESTAQGAAKANAELSADVLAALNKIKSAADKLESAGYNLSAVKQYDRVRAIQELKGYRAVHTLKYTSADIKTMGAVIDAAAAAGAGDISGPNWGLADPAQARLTAMQEAIKDAKAQAEALAATAGMRLGSLLRANSAPIGDGPVPMRVALAEANSRGSKLEPGSVVVGADVRCTYSLVPKKVK